MINNPLLVLLGPTASGKTKLGASLAYDLNAEIISADSRQVFKGMDIGTGKDLDEYMVNGMPIKYHLIDHKEAGSRYQVDAFKADFYDIFNDLTEKQKLPLLCGGTGMYIHSILQNHEYTSIPVNLALRTQLSSRSLSELQQELSTYPAAFTSHADQTTMKRLIRAIEIAEHLSTNDFNPPARATFTPLIIGLTMPAESRRARIKARLESRLAKGLIEEVNDLLDRGVSKEMLEFYGLEYKFVVAYLFKEISYEDLETKLFTAICQFAKRQMTFFRKMEKDGVLIHWFNANDEDLLNKAEKLILSKWPGIFLNKN